MTEIKLKRAYLPAEASDGYRVLVDRLWPRGVSKERLNCEEWAKDMAPSTELRKWYHADPANRWPEFEKKYMAEIQANPDLPHFLSELKEHPVVTFVYGARDPDHNHAIILEQAVAKSLESE